MYGSASGTRQMSAVSGNAFSAALGLEDALGGSRVLEQLLDGSARTAHELAAAVGTPAAKGLAGAGGAPGRATSPGRSLRTPRAARAARAARRAAVAASWRAPNGTARALPKNWRRCSRVAARRLRCRSTAGTAPLQSACAG